MRPGPEARDQSTAESAVTSPVAMPLGRVSRFRTSATPANAGRAGAAAWAAAGAAVSAAARTEPLTMVRREISVMAPLCPGRVPGRFPRMNARRGTG